MARPSANIKVIVAAGVPISDAVKAAISGSLADFAKRHGLQPPHVSMCIHGRQRHERVRNALAEELGVDRKWLDEQLDADRTDPGDHADTANPSEQAAA